jgi:DNA-binding GntR family transcriptional regulator
LETITVADAVVAELRRRLLAGEYAGGEELRDTDLTLEFGAARPTVRAAVQTLVADGLLERGRGRSARVRSFTAADAVDLYRLRRPIELAAVRLVLQDQPPLDRVHRAARPGVMGQGGGCRHRLSPRGSRGLRGAAVAAHV